MTDNLTVIVLAAGQGKRIGAGEQKVVRKLLGKPILAYLLDTIKKLAPERIVVVVGHKKENVQAELKGEPVTYAEQPRPLGTGDAVMKARAVLGDCAGDILILCGDVPFLTLGTMEKLIALHREQNSVCTLLTAVVDDPAGYGRIIKNGSGRVVGIMEDVNASPEEKKINEINAGVYVFKGAPLFDALSRLTPDAVKKEYYLTDVIKMFSRDALPVDAYRTARPEETMGINTLDDFKRAEDFLKGRTS